MSALLLRMVAMLAMAVTAFCFLPSPLTKTSLRIPERSLRSMATRDRSFSLGTLQSSQRNADIESESVRSRIAEILHSSLRQELHDEHLAVQGRVPSWLKGSLVRNGPALFEVGDEQFRHLFDGQAMLHSFVFDGDAGSIKYSNKMLKSKHLESHQEAGRVRVREFVSGPSGGILERLEANQNYAVGPFDNANVCVGKVGGKHVAMTESPCPVEFDPITAETVGMPGFDDAIENGLLTTAHPITARNGDSFNIMTVLGFGVRDDYYIIYRVAEDGTDAEGRLKRELICRVPATRGKAAYMHSFCLTDDLVILMGFPMRLSLPQLLQDEARRLLFGTETVATGMFTWQPDTGCDFLVVRVSTRQLLGRFHSAEPIFSYHPVNAAEDEEGAVHLDLTTYEREVVYPAMYLDQLRGGSEMTWRFRSDVRRYSLRLAATEEEQRGGSGVESRVLVDHLLEFPRISPDARGSLRYRFAYGTGPAALDPRYWRPLLKADVASGQVTRWEAPGTAPGEPIFVANPQGEAEDDGVLLSVVLDGVTERSFVLGLDASSMEETFRAFLPHHLPAGFHGEWFPAAEKLRLEP